MVQFHNGHTYRKLLSLRPLGGAEGRSDTRIRTWILIWLKPFKGGYSLSWRVVNISIYLNSYIVRVYFNYIIIYFREFYRLRTNECLTETYCRRSKNKLFTDVFMTNNFIINFHRVTCNFTSCFLIFPRKVVLVRFR